MYNPGSNTNIKALLSAWGGSDDAVVTQIKAAKDQLFVTKASGEFLDLLGSNVGVLRTSGLAVSDDIYRQLIPLLSFYPKQIAPTIYKLLEVFFGEGNPDIGVWQTNTNEIVVITPDAILFTAGRGLKGAFFLRSFGATVDSVSVPGNTVTITFDDPDQTVAVNQLAGAKVGNYGYELVIASNTAGNSPVLTLAAGEDIFRFTAMESVNLTLPGYEGHYLHDPDAAWQITGQRGILGEIINATDMKNALLMNDTSGIPDTTGSLVFDFGGQLEEVPVPYLGRPNNSVLLIDPTYIFTKDHAIGAVVNYVNEPAIVPETDGDDYAIYLAGTRSSIEIAQGLIRQIVAAGVVVRFIEIPV